MPHKTCFCNFILLNFYPFRNKKSSRSFICVLTFCKLSLMHNHHPYFPQKPALPLADQVSSYSQNADVVPIYNGPTFHNIDIQSCNACPRNFIIFDQTNNRSHIMFHPGISSKLFYPGFGFDSSLLQNEKNANNEKKVASTTFKEDSADIDALLSTEMEGNEEYEEDDDVVSTARTTGICDCNSPDSCSNYTSQSSESRSFFKKSNDKKRRRVRKMVKALRGIVPGGNRMSSVTVLDEAVKYLKSLRVEVQNLGIGSSKG